MDIKLSGCITPDGFGSIIEDVPMNGNGKIKPEELRFVYRLILEGQSDSAILNEYNHLGDIGELTFPLRTDEGFIKDRRVELNMASEVLKDSIKKIMKPFISLPGILKSAGFPISTATRPA